MKKSKKRRGANKGAKWLFVALVIFCVWVFSTFTLTTTEVEFKSEKVKDEITIVQLSDLHGSVFGMNNSALIKRIEKINPSFIAVTGDMYSAGSSEGRETALKLMKKLAENYPVYYVNGEHDNEESFFEDLRENNVKVLDYKTDVITAGETQIKIYGINNVYFTPTFDLSNEFTLDDEKYNLLLSHICNEEKFARFGMDLCLCGDTHGGQVRLPVIGGVYGSDGLFPELRKSDIFMKGSYKLENTDFFISSGLGNYPLPIRFLNRPEIAVIRLLPA